jgi:hypothetical protein
VYIKHGIRRTASMALPRSRIFMLLCRVCKCSTVTKRQGAMKECRKENSEHGTAQVADLHLAAPRLQGCNRLAVSTYRQTEVRLVAASTALHLLPLRHLLASLHRQLVWLSGRLL